MSSSAPLSYALWGSCQIRKIAGCACTGNAGNVSPPPRVSDPDMHHGTRMTNGPWCMPGSLTSGFLWSRWRGNSSRHSRRMHKSTGYTFLLHRCNNPMHYQPYITSIRPSVIIKSSMANISLIKRHSLELAALAESVSLRFSLPANSPPYFTRVSVLKVNVVYQWP